MALDCAARRHAEARAERDALLTEAARLGVPEAALASITGLAPATVRKLVGGTGNGGGAA